jgi:hypothetical protein
MEQLNYCRLYLQVIIVADIASADGNSILPDAKAGFHIPYRKSKLEWPYQGNPGKQSWQLWRMYLSTLETQGKLTNPWVPGERNTIKNGTCGQIQTHTRYIEQMGCNPQEYTLW